MNVQGGLRSGGPLSQGSFGRKLLEQLAEQYRKSQEAYKGGPFYGRFGFSRNRDPEIIESMVREPAK